MLLLENRIQGLTIADLRPNEVDYIKKNANLYTNFVTFLRDGFISTVAFRNIPFGRGKSKHEVLFVKEVHRWLAKQDEHYFCDYLSQPYMYNDWSVIFCMKDFKKHFWWQSAKPPRNGLTLSKSFKSGSTRNAPIGKELYGYEEFMRFMKENVHQYFYIKPESYRDFTYRHYIWHFAFFYRQNLPASEMLCKIGYPCFIKSKTICRFDKKKMKRLAKWVEQNGSIVTSYSGMSVKYPYKDIIYCAKHGLTIEQNEKRKLEEHAMKKLFKTREEVRDVIRYLRKQPYCKWHSTEIQKADIDHYADYLALCYRSGLDITQRGVQFPHDFNDRLHKLAAEEQRKEDKRKKEEFNAKLREVPKKLGLLEVSKNKSGFDFVIPTKASQFNELGNKLHNCVGSCGYKDKVVRGESLIIGVYKDGKPINCIELQMPTKEKPKYSVLQNYGDHNRPSACQDEVTKALATYITTANREWRRINGIA